jgi:thiol-disulfide isomerase/thioredoxin
MISRSKRAWAAGGLALTFALGTLAHASQLPRNFILHDAPKSIAGIRFEDENGKALGLSDFRGKVVLLNIWATWCGPCRREMPSLDRLQAQLGGADFQVVPLSIDRAGVAIVRKFYTEVGLKTLPIYIDTTGSATRALATVGVPATLLIDREGRELGRLVGPAEWDEPAIVEFLRGIIGGKGKARRQGDGTRLRQTTHSTQHDGQEGGMT